MVSARAVTNEQGSMRQSTITADGLATGTDFDPWLTTTTTFTRKMALSEIRDNINGSHRLDQFGTLAMYAFRLGFEDTKTCVLQDNKVNVCQDLYVGEYVFRKIKGLMYKRKIRKGEKYGANCSRYR